MPFKTYLMNKIQNKRFRLNGIVRSRRLPHKHRLCQSFQQYRLYAAEELPPKVDLRPDMTTVEDQSSIGSCTANSLAGAYEYLLKKYNGYNTDVSRLFIYYNARVKGNNSQSVDDSGCSMTDAIEALEEFGVCLESTWPYDISCVNTRPSDEAYDEAVNHKISEALQVNIDLNEMKSCLAQGFPFAFGVKLYTSFDKAGQTGVVPMPSQSEQSRAEHGSHAMLAVGYSDQSNAFIVRNSWGQDWGDKGYCYMPYDYLTNTDLCFDVWTVRKLGNNDFGQDNWHSHDIVNYSHVHRHRYSDDTDDDNRFIQGFDEDDGDGYNPNYGNNYNSDYGNNQDTWWNDNNPKRYTDDFSGQYQNYETNDNTYYDNRNQYNQNYDDFNPDRIDPFPNYDPFRNDRNDYGGYSDYN